MIELARGFEPTMILHHAHTTYSPRVSGGAWGATRETLPTAEVCASGIGFCGNPKLPNRWATLADVGRHPGRQNVRKRGLGRRR